MQGVIKKSHFGSKNKVENKIIVKDIIKKKILVLVVYRDIL